MGSAAKRKRKKLWSYQTGERGKNRVRAYEERKGGRVFLEFYEKNPYGELIRRRIAAPLDKEEAKAKADELAAKFRSMESDQPAGDQ